MYAFHLLHQPIFNFTINFTAWDNDMGYKHTCKFGVSGIGRNTGGWKFLLTNEFRKTSSYSRPVRNGPGNEVGSMGWIGASIPHSPPCKYVCCKTYLKISRPILPSSEASRTIWSCYANLNHYHYSYL